MFSSPEVDAVILVDATNAFNSLNRQAALRNILSRRMNHFYCYHIAVDPLKYLIILTNDTLT